MSSNVVAVPAARTWCRLVLVAALVASALVSTEAMAARTRGATLTVSATVSSSCRVSAVPASPVAPAVAGTVVLRFGCNLAAPALVVLDATSSPTGTTTHLGTLPAGTGATSTVTLQLPQAPAVASPAVTLLF